MAERFHLTIAEVTEMHRQPYNIRDQGDSESAIDLPQKVITATF
jgi:hypothetical protein